MKVTKKVVIVLILSMILSTLAGCGNTSAKDDGVRINPDGTVSAIGDSDDSDDSEDTEDDEDSDSSDDEATSDSSESENPENDFAEDDSETKDSNSSSASSTSTPSGDYVSDKSFWNGDDKFDLKGFLEANGCRIDDYWPDTPNDPDVAQIYEAYYGSWTLWLNGATGIIMTLNKYIQHDDGTTENVSKQYYTLNRNFRTTSPDKMITVTGGTTVKKSALDLMIIGIRSLREHPDDDDPLSHYNIEYFS